MDFLLPGGRRPARGAAGAAGTRAARRCPTRGAPRGRRAVHDRSSRAGHDARRDARRRDAAGRRPSTSGVSAGSCRRARFVRALAPPPPITVPGPEGLQPASRGRERDRRPDRPTRSRWSRSRDASSATMSTAGSLAARAAGSQGRAARARVVARRPAPPRLRVLRRGGPRARGRGRTRGRAARRSSAKRPQSRSLRTGRLAAVGSELGPHHVSSISRPARRSGRSPGRWRATASSPSTERASSGERGRRRARLGPGTSGALLGRAPEDRARCHASRSRPGAASSRAAGSTASIRLHDLDGDQTDENLKWHGSQITGLAWAGTILVSADSSGNLALWDLGDVGNVAAAVLGR